MKAFSSSPRAVFILAGFALATGALVPAPGRAQTTVPPPQRQQPPNSPNEAERLWNEGATALNKADYGAAETAFRTVLQAAERDGDVREQARCLTYLGFVYSNTGQQRRQIAILVRVLPLYKALNDPSNVAYTLSFLGSAHALLGEHQAAVQFHRRALNIVQTLPDSRVRVGRSAACHTALGLTYRALGRRTDAMAHLSRALHSYKALGDTRDVARSLSFLGAAYGEMGQHDKALAAHQSALRLQQRLPDGARGIAFTFLSLSGAYSSLHRYAEAAAADKRALAAFERLNDGRMAAYCLASLAQYRTLAGDYDAALAAGRRALALRSSAPNPAEIGQSFDLLAHIYEMRGEYDAASDADARALAAFRSLNDTGRVAQSLAHQGMVLGRQGRYDDALERLSRAVAILEVGDDTAPAASGLMSLGGVYDSLGQFDNAAALYHRALARWNTRGNTWQAAHCLLLLSFSRARQGRFEAALEAGNRAVALLERTGDQEEHARALSNVGSVYMLRGQARNDNVGDFRQAQVWCRRALRIHTARRSRRGTAECLVALGLASIARSHYDEAAPLLNRSLALALAERDRFLINQSLSGLAILYRERKQFDRALVFARRALRRAQVRCNRRDTAYSRNQVGRIYEKQGRLQAARTLFAQAIRDYETVAEQVADPGQAGAFQQANQQDLYARYAAVLVRLGRPADALAAVEQGRARGLALQAAESRADLHDLLAPADAQARQNRLAALAAAQRSLDFAQIGRSQATRRSGQANAAPTTVTAAERRVADAERALTTLRADLYRRYPRYRRLRGAEPPTPARLKFLARQNPDTLYLEWVVNEKSTLVFALSQKKGLRVVTLLAGRRTLAPAVARWRAALAAPADLDGSAPLRARRTLLRRASDEPAAARALSRLLLTPLEQAKLFRPGDHARLVIVPGGPLLDIPFAALMTGRGERLIERYALSTSVSLGTLTWPKNERGPTAPLLCAADPADTKRKPFLAGARAASLRRGSKRLHLSLPYARDEARQVAALFPGAVCLTGPQARERTVKQRMDRCAVLHFATHGHLATPGLRSWLQLTPEPANRRAANRAEDGRLEAREIAVRSLSARLAVLSACDSGRGEPSGGEGLLGLAWAFQAAGCSSVVASQWKVDDAATRFLMVAFYRALRAGRRKDDALRSAMRATRAAPGWAAPSFWAAFQVMGDALPLARFQPVTVHPGRRGTKSSAYPNRTRSRKQERNFPAASRLMVRSVKPDRKKGRMFFAPRPTPPVAYAARGNTRVALLRSASSWAARPRLHPTPPRAAARSDSTVRP